jgi:hypothetical protein
VSEARQLLPEDLEAMAPGLELAAVLASVDRNRLSDKDRVRLAQARNRLVAHQQGELVADLYAVSLEDEPDEDADLLVGSRYPWAEYELAFALRWTRFAAGNRLEQARRLMEDLPAVHRALVAGSIDMPEVLVICDGVQGLELPVARAIVEKVLARAAEQTTGQLRVRLRRLVLAADPQVVAKRAREDSKGRRVEVFLNDNQLAAIAGYELAPHRVAAGWERLTAIAKAAKAAGDGRRMDQLRADALLDLLAGEGIAAGGPVTDGGLDDPEPADADEDAVAADGEAPWPAAPAHPDLLVPEADPPADFILDDQLPAEPTPPPAAPLSDTEGEGDPTRDPQREYLDRFTLAAFGQLPTTAGCARCRGGAAPAGAMPAPRRGVVDLQMSLSTLMGLDDLPAELTGFGPLLADLARQAVAQMPELQWRFSLYNDLHELAVHGITHARPTTPAATATSGRRTKRRPTADVAAFVRARNRTCMAPGCRIPARQCELDHTVAWTEDGESEPENLGPGCTGHHHLKHAEGTDLTQGTPGFFGWTTPRGLQYLTKPTPPLYADPPPVVVDHDQNVDPSLPGP